jgi:High potential iron-sulfur protein
MEREDHMTRPEASLRRKTFLGSLAALPLLNMFAAKARADSSKASQASMHYQNSPNNGMHCSGCKFFIPGSDAAANGSCQIVDGSISPNGYCIAYAAK